MNRQPPAFAAFALLVPLIVLAGAAARKQEKERPPSAATNPSAGDLPPWNSAPTPRQIQALVTRVTENQHRDDQALEQYEWKERIVSHGSKGGALSEWSVEVVPVGFRLVRIELERDGQAADTESLQQRWQQAIQAVVRETKADDPPVKQNDDREAHRKRQRYEMVEAVGRAFRFRWMGRTNESGHAVLEFSFEPDATYKSSALFAIVYAHVVGTVWVDEANSQLVRIDVRLRDDISIGKGLIVKIYRGAQATLQQGEIAPGIWEPINFSFDYEGRKLVFSALSGHEQMEASNYRRFGSLEEVLATLRREHPDPTGGPQ